MEEEDVSEGKLLTRSIKFKRPLRVGEYLPPGHALELRRVEFDAVLEVRGDEQLGDDLRHAEDREGVRVLRAEEVVDGSRAGHEVEDERAEADAQQALHERESGEEPLAKSTKSKWDKIEIVRF